MAKGRAMTRLLTTVTLLVALAGCGGREPLRPAAGEQMPPAPAMAARAPTTDELLTPPPVARPERVDETLRRSEEREDDRFDLPPP
jgi:predicted small lipoprotein YifL